MSRSDVVKARFLPIIWYLGLLFLVPLLVLRPVEDVIRTPLAIVYVLLCALLLVAFAVMAPARRITSLVFLASLAAVQLYEPILGWDRIALIGVVMAVLGIVTEVVRQNTSLVGELAKQDQLLLWKLLRVAFLWSPMIGVAYIGNLANDWLLETSTRMVYTLTPIDQYCRGTSHGAAFPCEDEGSNVNPLMRKLTLDMDVRFHWEELFRGKQQTMLAFIANQEDDTFKNLEKLKKALTDMSTKVAPMAVLGMRDDNKLTKEELLARDVELQRLKNHHAALLRSARSIGGRGLGPAVRRITLEREAQQALQAASRREGALLSQKRELITTDDIESSVARQLSRALTKMDGSLDASKVLAKSAAEVPSMRAMLSALVVYRLADLEAASKKAALEIAEKVSDLRARRIREGGKEVPTAETQFEALGVKPYCTNATEIPDVFTDDDLQKKVEVNLEPFACSEAAGAATGRFERLDLDKSIDESIKHWRVTAEKNIEVTTREGLVKAIKEPASAGAQAKDLADMVPATINLGRKRCKLVEVSTWGNCAANYDIRRQEKLTNSYRTNSGPTTKTQED